MRLNTRVYLQLIIIAVASAALPPSGRILGGTTSSIHQFPYIVSVHYRANATVPYVQRCAGVVYTPRIILTTATCLTEVNPRQLLIIADSSESVLSSTSIIYLIDEITVHPDYNRWFYDNDLALLHLGVPLPAITTISIANEVPMDYSLAKIAGWGLGSVSGQLRSTRVNTVPVDKCRQAYGALRISNAMLCAAAVDLSDACDGDAGGPLVVANALVGLVSWGYGCGQPDFPGVYTNLVPFKQWIDAVAKR